MEYFAFLFSPISLIFFIVLQIDRVANVFEIKQEFSEEDNYEIAITKIAGKKMNNIIVDSEKTAKECIKCIKDHFRNDKFSVIETFLPLDFIKIKPLEHVKRYFSFTMTKFYAKYIFLLLSYFIFTLSKIENESEAVLAIDVVNFEVQLKSVMRHILGDTVICKTDDEACNLSSKKRLNVIAIELLNFTFSPIP